MIYFENNCGSSPLKDWELSIFVDMSQYFHGYV